MIQYFIEFLKQTLFSDIFNKLIKIKEQNIILKKQLKQLDRKQRKKIKEATFRRNRELGFTVIKAVHDVGNLNKQMNEFNKNVQNNNFQLMMCAGKKIFTELVKEKN